MRMSRYASGVAVVALTILLFVTPAFAQTRGADGTTSTTQAISGDIPADILVLLKRDQSTLTAEEREKIIAYVESTRPGATSPSTTTSGTVNCFDYYRFGSVQVDLSPTLSQTVSGTPMTFAGEVKNTNPYPIVDGQVYVKIFMNGGGSDFNSENGSALVDQFSLPETFVLPAHGSKKASFSWKVPDNAPAGDYTAAFFFQTAKRYNLLGLSFTDDVTGNQAHFSVTSDDARGVVFFDKNGVTLNGALHRFAAFPLRFAKDEPITAVVKLVNPRDETVTVPVTWKLYSWDSLRAEALKDTKAESYQLKPKEVKEISYVAAPIDATVSYLVAEAHDSASKSILDIRFVRDGIDETRINFPSIASYPLEAGKENTLFSCMHSTNTPLVNDNTLTLTLRDDRNNVIHTYQYIGGITSAMMGVKDSFTPAKTYASFSLTATLTHAGKTVEEVTQTYDCSDIDVTLCPISSPSIASEIIIGVLALLLFAFLGLKIFRSRKEFPTAAMMVFFLLSLSLLAIPERAEAKSVSVVQNQPVLGFSEGSANPSGVAIGAIATTVTYNATATLLGVSISDGASVPSGSTIRVQWSPSGGISWVGTGGVYDSPYGRWDSSAKACTTYNECSPVNRTDWAWGGSYVYSDIYQGDLAVSPPTFSVSGSGLSCSATQGGVRTSGPSNAFFCQVLGGSYCTIVVSYSPFYSDCVVTASSGQSVDMLASYPDANASLRAGQFASYDRGTTAWYARSGGASFTVPATSISFAFTAVDANSPPATPVVTSPGTGYVNTSYDFTATATDPDSDTVRYGFDWNGDTLVNEWAPAAGYVPSGTSQTVSHSWSSVGYKSINVYAQDSRSMTSSARTVQIRIISAADCIAPWGSVVMNNGRVTAYQSSSVDYPTTCSSASESRVCTDGVLGGSYTNQSCSVTAPVATLSADPATTYVGQSATLTWGSSGGASVCRGTGLNTRNAVSGSVSTQPFTTPGTRNYQVYCTRYSDGARSSTVTASVEVLAEPAVVSISASPSRVKKGGATLVTWDASGVSSCTVEGPGLSSTQETGSQSITITAQSIYTITCDGIEESTRVNVTSDFDEF